jgi:hypothetical protein
MNPEDPYYNPVPEMPISPQEIAARQFHEEKLTSLMAEISPSKALKEIHLSLKGYVKDPVSNSWVKLDPNFKEPHPLLISRYLSFLSSILGENTSLSNYSTMEINRMMKMIIEFITDDLKTNAQRYGIGEDYTERSRIGMIILNPVFAVFKRAQNGMESKRVFNIMQIRETTGEQKPKSVSDFLQFWK